MSALSSSKQRIVREVVTASYQAGYMSAIQALSNMGREFPNVRIDKAIEVMQEIYLKSELVIKSREEVERDAP